VHTYQGKSRQSSHPDAAQGAPEHAQRRIDATRAPAWTGALPLRPKLTVTAPGDAFEQEADQVAARVMRMAEPVVQREPCADCPDEESALQRQVDEEEDEQEAVQLKASGGDSGGMAAPDSVYHALSGGGQPLDSETRAYMEPRFGQDFSGVRVHIDSQAAQSAAEVGARAYTVGQDVVFGAGEYAPGTTAGKQLIAHELAHTVQQTHVSPRVSRQMNMACTETARWPGNYEHAAIESDYAVNVNPVGAALEFAIPGSGPGGGTGYADIVDLSTHAIYEIKTWLGKEQGRIEVLRYLNSAINECDPDAPWHAGVAYPPRVIPMTDNTEIVTQQYPDAPGVIVYWKRRRKRQPETEKVRVRQPMPATDRTWQDALRAIKKFLEDVVQGGLDAEAAAQRFLQENPWVQDFLIGAAITIVVATIIEDIVTLGAGLLDDPASMAAAFALVRIAQTAPAR